MIDTPRATQPTEAEIQAQVRELEEENELLLLQLHQVQEELERYYLRNKELEQGRAGAQVVPTGWVDEELPDLLAEQIRLKAQLDTGQNLHHLQSENALNVKIGNMLMDAAKQGALLAVPGKLIKIRRQLAQTTPPAALGGKDFAQVIATWQKGGLTAVAELLAQVPTSQAMQAKAYTALARYLCTHDQKQAAEAARLAYAAEPKDYRLKWLAFRLYEADDIIEAEALLDLLPADTTFSDSEERQASQLRSAAKQARLRQAQQQSNYQERRAAAAKQLRDLAFERDALKKSEAKLQQDKAALDRQYEEQKRLAADRQAQIDELAQDNAAQTERNTILEQHLAESHAENELLLNQLHQVQEELEGLKLDKAMLESDKSGLIARQQELTQALEVFKVVKASYDTEKAQLSQRQQEMSQELETLKAAKAVLASEKSTLAKEQQETTQTAADRLKQINDLKQEIDTRKAKEVEIEQRQQETVKELESLKAAKAELESEKAQLSQRQQEMGTELDSLKAAKAVLESEKSALAKEQQETTQTAADRLKQINELKQEIDTRKAKQVELERRQQLMNEEMVRAEAQIDLIKDMLLREPGL